MSLRTNTVKYEENQRILLQEIQKMRILQCKKVDDRAEYYWEAH